MNPDKNKSTSAALTMLIILQLIMLTSLFAGIPPHPPVATPLFGIGPFLGVSLGCAATALVLGPITSSGGRVLTVFAALLALVSFGPQKYFDAQFALIWPAVIAGQLAAAFLLFAALTAFRKAPSGEKSPRT